MFTAGERVRDYEVVGAVTGGKSQSWQAKKDRELYFLKLLPRPKYPRPDKPTPDRYQRMLTVCADFEQRNFEIMHMLSNTIVGGGNLVKPTEFFREGNCYFKSYRFIPGESSLAITDSYVTRKQRLLFLRTFLLCLRELHAHGIVHGDLKPENVLIERRDVGPVARLIDFDEAYLTGRPPPPNQAPGSEDYYSPELVRYRNDELAPAGLTVNADVFALGLVIHVALTGRRPMPHGGWGETPAEIVATGGTLEFDHLGLGIPEFEAMVRGTAAPRPADRPSVADLLGAIGVDLPSSDPPPPPPPPSPPPPPPTTSRVISTMGRKSARTDSSRTSSGGAP